MDPKPINPEHEKLKNDLAGLNNLDLPEFQKAQEAQELKEKISFWNHTLTSETSWTEEQVNHSPDALQKFLDSKKQSNSVEQLQHDVEHLEAQIKSAVKWFMKQNPNIIPLVDVSLDIEFKDITNGRRVALYKEPNVKVSIQF